MAAQPTPLELLLHCERRKQEAQGQPCLPRPFSVGQSMISVSGHGSQWAARHLAAAPNRVGRIAGFAQRREGALERQEYCSASHRGIAVYRIQLGVRVGRGQGQIQFLASVATSRSGSNTVLFLSMKYTARASLMATTVLALNLLPSMRVSSRWARGRIRK